MGRSRGRRPDRQNGASRRRSGWIGPVVVSRDGSGRRAGPIGVGTDRECFGSSHPGGSVSFETNCGARDGPVAADRRWSTVMGRGCSAGLSPFSTRNEGAPCQTPVEAKGSRLVRKSPVRFDSKPMRVVTAPDTIVSRGARFEWKRRSGRAVRSGGGGFPSKPGRRPGMPPTPSFQVEP